MAMVLSKLLRQSAVHVSFTEAIFVLMMTADYFQSTVKINSMCDTRHLGLTPSTPSSAAGVVAAAATGNGNL